MKRQLHVVLRMKWLFWTFQKSGFLCHPGDSELFFESGITSFTNSCRRLGPRTNVLSFLFLNRPIVMFHEWKTLQYCPELTCALLSIET